MNRIKEVHILNHTHWDREWYETFEEFRYKLRNGLRYVQRLLDEGQIESFFLDGQTIVLDDFKEIVNEAEYEKLLQYIKNGKIEVGPWYLLADEFLVSGESIIKNLELGIKKAKESGSTYKIGYLPDTFGHNSQMPQIFQGYNIPFALIWRGAVSNTLENEWVGADGSSVRTVVLPLKEGYYQTFLKHKGFIEETDDYIRRSEPYVTQGKLLLMNGADHTYTCENLDKRVAQLNEQFQDITFKQSSMSAYIKTYEGQKFSERIYEEQRNPSKVFILPGVYSTRSYLKRDNQRCEDEAVSVMEALNVWTNGNTNSEQFMEYVWKLILQNQPHDSICGCSIDAVHTEMEVRSQKALHAIEQFKKDILNNEYPFEFLDETVENSYLYCINNLPFAAVYPVYAQIKIPATQDLGAIKLFYNEKELSFDLLKREQKEGFFRQILAEPHYGEYVYYDVLFMLEFNGVETKRVEIKRAVAHQETITDSKETFIENEFYRITWDNRGLKVEDRKTGTVYDNQHQLISSLDAGDTYNYSPPINDQTSKTNLVKVTDVVKGKNYQSLTLHYEMNLPASLNKERTGPSKHNVMNTIVTTVKLYKHNKQICFKTAVHNQAKDQKLRVGFQVRAADYSYSDTAFDARRRETIRDKQVDVPKDKEAIMNQYPTYSSVIANDHQVVHRGMQEYEVDRLEDEDYVFLTMIRSVGWLSRRDLRTRGNGAGPSFEVKGAQCLGQYEFEYALIVGEHNHSWNNGRALRQSVVTQQSMAYEREQQLFIQSSQKIVHSSFMQAGKGAFYIRMFNPSELNETTMLSFGINVAELSEVNFDNEIMYTYEAKSDVEISFKPKEIKTLLVKRGE